MYCNGQVVHSLEHNCPVKVGDDSGSQFAWTNLQGETTHYIEVNSKHSLSPEVPRWANGLPQRVQLNGYEYRYAEYGREQEYSIALPATIEEAKRLLKAGLISPAPRSK